MKLPKALQPLAERKRWVVWRWEKRGDVWTKPPYRADKPKLNADVTKPATWSTYDEARKAAPTDDTCKLNNGGVGYVLSPAPQLDDDDVGGVDLDHCRNPKTGKLLVWAEKIIKEAAGAYIEVSPSGRGVRIIGLVEGDKTNARVDYSEGGHAEAYRRTPRYLTVTGRQLGSCQKLTNIDALIDELKAMPSSPVGVKGDGTESGLFYQAVCRLVEKGLDVDEIVADIAKRPRHWRGKKVERFSKRTGGVRAEVERCVAKKLAQTPQAVKEVRWTNGKLPKPSSVADARIAIQQIGLRCSYDTFHSKMLIEGLPKETHLTDRAVAKLRMLILQKFGFDPGKQTASDALEMECLEYEFDPVVGYLNSLIWDGKKRIDSWVVDYLGCKDTELNRQIGRLTLIAAVRRARHPGTKFDQIVVLEGLEGINKSSAIEVLAGKENFSDQTILGVHDKEQQELMQGKWLYEIADLRGIRTADVDHIKAFASRTVDRARLAYDKYVTEQPRRCILWGTSNDRDYLRGDSNRRFWPLPVTCILINRLRRDRDQLWAEAAALEAEKGTSIELPWRLWGAAKDEQAERVPRHPWEDNERLRDLRGTICVDSSTGDREERVLSNDLIKMLEIPNKDLRPAHYLSLRTVMHRLGWEGPKNLRIGKSNGSGYCRPAEAGKGKNAVLSPDKSDTSDE